MATVAQRLAKMAADIRALDLGQTAPKFDDAFRKFERAYQDTYSTLARQFPNLKDALAFPPPLSSAFDVYIYGRDVAWSALKTKQVPQAKVKAFERAFKVFDRKKRPKDMTVWFIKNLAAIQVLLDAKTWKDQSDANGGGKLSVGPFTLIDQAGLGDLSSTAKLIEQAASAIRSSSIPGASKTLYGDVYVVGSIQRKKTTAALYQTSSDKIFVLLLKRFSGKHLHSLIHEFGHRYWARFMDRSKKLAWESHHMSVMRKPVDVIFPKVGDPVEGVKGNPKVERYEGKKIYLEGGGYITTRQYENFMEGHGRAKTLPTPYSATNAEEHFCEAWALYCLGSLSGAHKATFQALVK